MNDYKKVKLGDYIQQIRGVSYKPEDVSAKHGEAFAPLFRAHNIQSDGLNCDDLVYVNRNKIRKDQYIQENDIVVCTSSGSKELVGKAAQASTGMDISFGAFCKVVRSKNGILPSYLNHFFSSPQYRLTISGFAAGANINNLRNEHIDDLLIPLPPIYKQQNIAQLLDCIVGLIAKHKQQKERLDLLIKSRFVEMFGDSRINSKGWEAASLDAIGDVGSSRRVFVSELKGEGVPFYRGTEIGALATGNEIQPELFITQEHYEELCLASGKPKRGDLLMPSICPDGRIWLVDTDAPFYFKDGRVLWVHPVSDKIDSCYLKYFLKNLFMTNYESIASGTTFVELKIFALKQIQVMLAPIKLQKLFSEFVEQTDKSKFAIQKSLAELETLKKALMQQYFG